jgi:hypothetical protein
MELGRSDFLPDDLTGVDLTAWADLLPNRHRILGANLFADMFVTDAAGAVHMLEVSAGSISKIATSEKEFRGRCIGDEDGWFLRPLVDRCRSAGKLPIATQCFAFTTLPLFGGEYAVSNIWICS